jgi:hypothetical protein
MKITYNGQYYYASWRDSKGELRFVYENTRLRAISVGLFCAMGLTQNNNA